MSIRKLLGLGLMSLLFVSCGGDNTSSQNQSSPEVIQPEAAELVQAEAVVEPVAAEITSSTTAVEELGSGDVKWTEESTDYGFTLVYNDGGATLGYSPDSGVSLLQVEGYAFKDLNQNGQLDVYEDWRVDAHTRAQQLVLTLTVEEMAGLFPHASHFNLSEDGSGLYEPLQQGIRTVLNFGTAFPVATQATWNNAIQAYAEGLPHGIPVTISTNPRTAPTWPTNLGLAATFDPDLVFEISKNISKEYRALGVSTLLGPQIDLASEPRWVRVWETFGEDPALSRDMTNASVSGHQSTYDEHGNDLGWGPESVNAMMKHWPSDGPGESGRESHDFYGQFTVYPGDQFETQLIPFVDGGLSVESKTGSVASVMSSYSIAFSETGAYGESVGSAFSEYKNSLLRGFGFDGVICSDWGVVDTGSFSIGWGLEEYSTPERCYMAIMSGTDQLGNVGSVEPILEAYEIGVFEQGEEVMFERFQESARRTLRTAFQVGLFENSYVNVDKAVAMVGGKAMQDAGYEAQLKTVVMLKNNGVIEESLVSNKKPTVYIPLQYIPAISGFRGSTPASADLPVDLRTVSQYFTVVTDTVRRELTGSEDSEGKATIAYADIIRATPEEVADCDFALVFVDSPNNVVAGITSGGYDAVTEEYIPISLQYEDYVATSLGVRDESISGSYVEQEVSNVYGVQNILVKENNSYYGKSAQIHNATDLDMIRHAIDIMPAGGDVIVAINAKNPMIVSEFEAEVGAILMGFNTNKLAFVDVVRGVYEPSGLLPFQMPVDMETVEAQFEDVPRDMECYVDSAGNVYDFAYGLNWSGVISDARTAKYNVAPLVGGE